MQYKSIKEQNEKIITIIKQNKDLISILDYIAFKFTKLLYCSRIYFSNNMELL